MPIELSDYQRSGRVDIVLDCMKEIIEDLRTASPDSPLPSKEEIAERLRSGAPRDPAIPLIDAIDLAADRLDAVRTILADTME